MASKTELAQYIRFQLSQLRSLNKHHTFEDLARQFARLRICENILPATGPVGTGGDQGRDFETYRSYLAGTPIATSSFLGRVANSEKKLVFACSLQEKIVAKIKSDVKTICGSAEKIDGVYYFCEANLPVAKRHDLQQWSRDTFTTELEVFDGQALSEQLTDLDVFWIAEEYLDVPAEMYPRIAKEPTPYTEYQDRWLNDSRRPYSYADFFQVKYGIRAATFETFAKPDIVKWIATMEMFRGAEFPLELQRRATYEICVAALRGQNNLTAKRSLVEEYFSNIEALSSASELEDAAILLSYCSTAVLKGHFEIAPEKLLQWSRTLIKRLEGNLKIAPNPHVRCNLLQVRGYAGLLQVGKGPALVFDPKEGMKWWSRLVKEIPNAPLFPLEHFADLLCKMTEWIGEDPQFRKLAQNVDELLSARSSEYVAADKCRERALTYYKNERYVLAIQELHQAKVKWFSAETLHGSLLAMLLLSSCYHHLGLLYAAKYYAACVAYLAYYHNDDRVKQFIPKALFALAGHCYGAGEWFSFLQLASLAFSAHNMYDVSESDDDEEEHDLDRTFGHTCILKAITQRLDPALSGEVDAEIARWPIDPGIPTGLSELAKNEFRNWQTWSLDTLWTTAQQQLSGRPFCDLGTQRTICWKALGINWSVHFENDWSTVIMAEEFVATLQILLADLAGEDLCLLPTTVKIQSCLTESGSCSIKDEPNNQLVQVSVLFPRTWVSKPEFLDELRKGVFAIAMIGNMIAASRLRKCSSTSSRTSLFKPTWINVPSGRREEPISRTSSSPLAGM